MIIEYEMSEENEKSCLSRAIIFRIMSINHEFSMNSIMINQNVEMNKKEQQSIKESNITYLYNEKINFFIF